MFKWSFVLNPITFLRFYREIYLFRSMIVTPDQKAIPEINKTTPVVFNILYNYNEVIIQKEDRRAFQ